MLQPAINFKWWPSRAMHLDIARTGITLRHARQISTQPLSLKPGELSNDDCTLLLEAISRLLPDKRQAAARIDISVSDALSRCWTLTRLPGLANPEELEALARLQLKTIFGDSDRQADAWVVRLDARPFARHWPVIALPRNLLEMCEKLTSENNLTLKSLQPRFVRAGKRQGLSGWPFYAPGKPVIQVLECSDSVSIGIRHGINWPSLRVHPPLASLGLKLQTLIRRDCLAAGVAFESCSLQQLAWPPETQVLPEGT